ncbi:MAG TPA: response regulator [Caulobacter sp.]|nr:response regulator [Caulobacter sp.]
MEAMLSGLKVLLVDDNEHMRTIVGAILKGIGVLDVREASDGSEGLDALRRWPADLAIVDFRMEPMDGVDFTRLIRNAEDSVNPFLPIIMMTGFADRPRVEEARDAGVTELIVKPVTSRAIIDRLNAVIFKPRPFVRTADYFGPRRRGIDDVAHDDQSESNYARI